MKKYTVKNYYRYIGEIEVEADSKEDALEKALGMDDDPVYDVLMDSKATEIK